MKALASSVGIAVAFGSSLSHARMSSGPYLDMKPYSRVEHGFREALDELCEAAHQ